MISFLPAPILFIINFIGITLITLLVFLPVLLVAIIQMVIPHQAVIKALNKVIQAIFDFWCYYNAALIRLTNNVKWDLPTDIPKIDKSCIVICNHLSWTDIVMLLYIYRGKIPVTKFFLKHSLIYIPFIGMICYALGMPFLKRYPKGKLLKNRNLRNNDIKTTKKACNIVFKTPSSLVNFLEGTRFNEKKAKEKGTPYKHLMPPKLTSLGISLQMSRGKVDTILNTTLLYPDNKDDVFIQMLCGRLHTVIARVEQIKITDDMCGDYLGDREFKNNFSHIFRQIWQEKDDLIDNLLKSHNNCPQT